MDQLPEALRALKSYPQFMLYKLVPSTTRPGKTDKFPVSITTGDVVSAHDSQHWTDADTAVNLAKMYGSGYGVAFVLTENDPFFFIDIDDCLTPSGWSDIATELCGRFAGAAVEVSQSGRGLHIIGSLAGGSPEHGCKNIPLGLECYTEARFIALTGSNAMGDAATLHDASLNTVVAQYFPIGEVVTGQEWTTVAHPDSCPIEDDTRLIEKALKTESAASVFGSSGKASFKDLWTANEPALTAAYPDEVRSYDASSADSALAQHLAFWTGGNCERIERLMRQSALKRDKWDKHRSYMSRTIIGAVSRQKQFYSVGKPIDIVRSDDVVVSDGKAVRRTGSQFISNTQLEEYFAGCVYVADVHKVIIPNGTLLKSEQFNAMYGGYTFALDDMGDKTTRKAWEAFTESQGYVFPKADKITFDPSVPYGAITSDEESVKYVNVFKARVSAGKPGNVDVFINHIRKLYGADADILLDWIAVKVQNPGKCMLWAPVLIGTYGNGKTTISDAVAQMIGDKWCAIVQSSDVDNKFNGWVFGNVFAAINDFKVSDKNDVMEILKPLVTDRKIAYQKKGADTDKCLNMLGIIITSNHLNAVVKTDSDRRYSIFISPHESEADLIADGMDSKYFETLNNFITNRDCIDYLRHYFLNRHVAIHPVRAPRTSTTSRAVSASLGTVEQEIMDMVDEGLKGFAGGWISSIHLDTLISKMRADSRVPRNRRREMLKQLGYELHPALRNGRANNSITIDGGRKPYLYIKVGHIHANLTSPALVALHYQAAQGDPIAMGQLQQKTGT